MENIFVFVIRLWIDSEPKGKLKLDWWIIFLLDGLQLVVTREDFGTSVDAPCRLANKSRRFRDKISTSTQTLPSRVTGQDEPLSMRSKSTSMADVSLKNVTFAQPISQEYPHRFCPRMGNNPTRYRLPPTPLTDPHHLASSSSTQSKRQIARSVYGNNQVEVGLTRLFNLPIYFFLPFFQ